MSIPKGEKVYVAVNEDGPFSKAETSNADSEKQNTSRQETPAKSKESESTHENPIIAFFDRLFHRSETDSVTETTGTTAAVEDTTVSNSVPESTTATATESTTAASPKTETSTSRSGNTVAQYNWPGLKAITNRG